MVDINCQKMRNPFTRDAQEKTANAICQCEKDRENKFWNRYSSCTCIVCNVVTSTSKDWWYYMLKSPRRAVSWLKNTFPSFFYNIFYASRKKRRKKTRAARMISRKTESVVLRTVKFCNLTCGETSWNWLPSRHQALSIFTYATYVSDFARWWLLIAR